LADAQAIDILFANAFSPEKVATEQAYLDRPDSGGASGLTAGRGC